MKFTKNTMWAITCRANDELNAHTATSVPFIWLFRLILIVYWFRYFSINRMTRSQVHWDSQIESDCDGTHRVNLHAFYTHFCIIARTKWVKRMHIVIVVAFDFWIVFHFSNRTHAAHFPWSIQIQIHILTLSLRLQSQQVRMSLIPVRLAQRYHFYWSFWCLFLVPVKSIGNSVNKTKQQKQQ